MRLSDLHDDETLDDLDRERAADMEDSRPIYIIVIAEEGPVDEGGGEEREAA